MGKASKAHSLDPQIKNRKATEQEVLHHFRIVVGAMREHFRTVEAITNVGGSQLWALSEIMKKPGMKVGELAEALSIHTSTASNLLDKLEKKELIRRERKDRDNRTVRLMLTEAGTAIVSGAPQPHEGLVRNALKNLPENALLELYRGLEQLAAEMKVTDEKTSGIPLADL